MDLIYTDKNLIDQGILQDYSFDEEYGIGEKDTNTFECKIQKYNSALHGTNPIGQDSLLYIEFTEYGGIVDRIESDTNSGVVTLSGRTWHGILNSRVIEPPTGAIYRTYSGTVHDILTEMLADTGLDYLFEVDPDDANDPDIITVGQFNVRYELLYDAIVRMLQEYDAKFKCYYYRGKIHIVGVPAMNYALMDEFDSSQVPFTVGLTYNNINHMVCLGQGNGEKRAVIHLFADEYGAVQPYTKVDEPIQDSDYILDKSNQVMTGLDERAYIYNYPNAEITYNYPVLTEQPADWISNYYKKYYVRGKDDSNGNQRFNLIERVFMDVFHLLTHEPSNWRVNEGYKNYYTCNADGTEGTAVRELQEDDPDCVISYVPSGGKVGKFWDWESNYHSYYEPSGQGYASVPSRTITKNDNPLYKQPADWTWNWKNYNTRYWNGSDWIYNAVQSVITVRGIPHTSKPADWETNFGNYYVKAKKQKKENGKVTIVKGSFITVQTAMDNKWLGKQKGKKYPKWKAGAFYNIENIESAPSFPSVVYYPTQTQVAPIWEDRRYYKREVDRTPKFRLPDPANGFYGFWELRKNEEQIPEWTPNTYHYQTEDRYRMLVEDALEKFKELTDTSTLEINLELESNYDVGDIVGSTDEVTGISVNKPILRKVIKIKKDIISISHEVE